MMYSLIELGEKIFIVFIIIINVNYVNCICSSTSDNFNCTNGNTVSCAFWRDNINDCGDNSDEGYLNNCRFVTIGSDVQWQFKCTMETIADYSAQYCQAQFKIKDNFADCPDKSDEQLIVGDSCAGKDAQIGCDVFMSESFCNTAGVCECRSGTYVAPRNADCIIRKLGDSCTAQTDCTDAQTYYRCLNNVCACIEGYTAQSDNSTCSPSRLGDSCTLDIECSNSVQYSVCTDNVCACGYEYILDTSDNQTCLARKVGDPCATSDQCAKHLLNGFCNSALCECLPGSAATNNDTYCRQTHLFENCTSNTDCVLISYGYCNGSEVTKSTDVYNNGTLVGTTTTTELDGVCNCQSSFYLYDYRLWDCAKGLGDLYCDSDVNCTTHFGNLSACYDNNCECHLGYYGYNYLSCVLMQLGDACRNDSDCTLLSNSYCDEYKSCQCKTSYIRDGQSNCILDTSCTRFECKYPWAVFLILLLICGIVAGIVVLIVWFKCFREPKKAEAVVEPPAIIAHKPAATAPIVDINRARLLTPLEKTRERMRSAQVIGGKKKAKKVSVKSAASLEVAKTSGRNSKAGMPSIMENEVLENGHDSVPGLPEVETVTSTYFIEEKVNRLPPNKNANISKLLNFTKLKLQTITKRKTSLSLDVHSLDFNNEYDVESISQVNPTFIN